MIGQKNKKRVPIQRRANTAKWSAGVTELAHTYPVTAFARRFVGRSYAPSAHLTAHWYSFKIKHRMPGQIRISDRLTHFLL